MGKWVRGPDSKPAFQTDDGQLLRKGPDGKIVRIDQIQGLAPGRRGPRSKVYLVALVIVVTLLGASAIQLATSLNGASTVLGSLSIDPNPTPPLSSVYPAQLVSPLEPPIPLEADPETLAPQSLITEIASLSPTLFQSISIPNSVYQPTILSNQKLLIDGTTPAALYIGGEYCEHCAAMRWAIVVAFSQFGTFSNLAKIQSSVENISTFSFHRASYQSPYLDFQMVERFGNDANHLSQFTLAQAELWNDFSSYEKTQSAIPFLDIGNKVFYDGGDFNEGILSGLSQSQIAADLTNPMSAISKSILGAAIFLVAGICSITGQQPSAICSIPRIESTETFLGIYP